MSKYFFTIVLSALFLHLDAQHLSRRPFLGILMDPVTDSIVRAMDLPKSEGIFVKNVIHGSAAEASGLAKNDILITLGDSTVSSPTQVMVMLKTLHKDQTLPYSIIREKKLIAGELRVKEMPHESYAGLDVTYGEMSSGSSLLRTILTSPKGTSKKPAILFVQGIGCYSMDSPLDSNRAEIQLISHLARKGFIILRVDKSGMGDSKGTPCDQLDFDSELAGYKQAYGLMKGLPDVDTAHCFIIGHSMGGVMAPLIAKETSVKGIIAYGTIGVNFMEYWVNTRKTLADAYNMNPIDKDDYIKEQCQCASLMLDAHMHKDEAAKINPNCKEVIENLLMRDYPYWTQLTSINIPAAWQSYTGKVLAMWGSADFISAREEHHIITDIVNKSHPGNATFKEIANASHGMQIAYTFQEGLNTPGAFNTAIETTMNEWLQSQLN